METETLASFTSGLSYDKLSSHSVSMAKQCMLDWLGVCIRGAQERPVKIIRQIILKPRSGKSTVLDGESTMSSVLNAAFCNGAASHSLDFDDLHNPSIIHLATVVLPPALAIAEAENKSGQELISAICAGYEAGGRVGESIIPESYFYWHTTGTAGIFGSAAAAANLLQLDAEQTLMCYGSAGTQAAGLWEFLKDGAMSKVLHAGKASYGGALSAYLAREGFTGARQILEGEKGFCHAVSNNPHLEKLTEHLDCQKLKIDNNSFKPYSCCKHSHAALYGTQVLCRKHSIHSDDIKKIQIFVNEITDYLINNPTPSNPYGCKFSIQYCVAAMIKYGQVGIDQFKEDLIGDKEIRGLMEKTDVIKDPGEEHIHQQDPAKLASKIVLTLKNGQKYEIQVDFPKGDPDNPFSWEETKEKFMSLAVPVYGKDISANLCGFVENLESCTHVSASLSSILHHCG